MISLPIDPYIPEIIKLWSQEKNIILSASPGSGKTTRLPWALSQKTHKRIVVLEPRKLAAKMAAVRIAQENNLTLGKEVGHAYRDDVRFNEKSKVIFFTEGTFVKFIKNKSFLETIDTIIFDEFHERHLETDLCLALVRSLIKDFPELKLLLMSATINTQIAQTLNAKSVEIDAQFYQVKLHYLPNTPSVLNQELALKVRNVIKELPPQGDILVFLPGMKEILRTQEILQNNFGQTFVLHSEVKKNEQEAIMLAGTTRRIILATNIAESSLTIPDITYIIDSGIVRSSEYNPWNGVRTLVDRPITQSSAIQRMYRAGRTQNGECYRLYSKFDYQQRPQYTIPEILTADLNDVYLLSCSYQHQLTWITPPPQDKWKRACELNELLGLSFQDKVTEIGKFALKYDLNIRVARILWEAQALTINDKELLIKYICQNITQEDPKYLRRRLAAYLTQPGQKQIKEMARYLLAGMIDQVAKYRSHHNDFTHYSGKIFKVQPNKNFFDEGLYILTAINHRERVEEALAIQEEWLLELTPYPLIETQEVIWTEEISVSIKTTIGRVVLEEFYQSKRWDQLSEKEQNTFLEKNSHKFESLIKDFTATTFYKRGAFYAKKNKINLAFAPSLQEFLEFDQGSLHKKFDFFKYKLNEALNIDVEYELPETITINNKKFIIQYEEEASIEGYIQLFFGLKKTPTILKNIPLTLILLGPHGRPIQYTKDIEGFWSRTYQQDLKVWRREYPRHHWPEDPTQAPAVLLKRHLTSS